MYPINEEDFLKVTDVNGIIQEFEELLVKAINEAYYAGVKKGEAL